MSDRLESIEAGRQRRSIWLGILVFCALPLPGIVLTPKAAIVAIAFLIGILCLILNLRFRCGPAAPTTMLDTAQEPIEESTRTTMGR